MKNYKILDTTLRDGGYCNNWNFSEELTFTIVNELNKANIDYIECGIIKPTVLGTSNSLLFPSMREISLFYSSFSCRDKLVCLVNYGEITLKALNYNKQDRILKVRVAFYKKDMNSALSFCLELMNMGYQVFVQPMAISSYSKNERIILFKEIEKISPYAFYVVDSFGCLVGEELIELFNTLDSIMPSVVKLGFHGHTNLGQENSILNALYNNIWYHEIIIDGTINGIGRGAGNIRTERLCSIKGKGFQQEKLNEICHEIFSGSHSHKQPQEIFYWSAIYKCHPNYASFFYSHNLDFLHFSKCLKALSEIGIDEYDEKIALEIMKDLI